MKKSYLPYDKNLKRLSRELRNNSTFAEVLLWNKLKSGQLQGYKFNRQKPLGNFIVDFYCKKLNLAIELDGEIHKFTKEKDKNRQAELERMGLKVIRFDNMDVEKNMNGVLFELERYIQAFKSSI